MSASVCDDENRLLAALAWGFMAPWLLVVALLVHGCNGTPSSSAPLVRAPTVAFVAPGVSYDLAATPAQIARGLPYVQRYLDHWGSPCTVSVVHAGSLYVGDAPKGGCREVGAGRVWLTYAANGTVIAAEWEIPLEAQGAMDPSSWTWGTWGPLYDGMPEWAREKSK